MGVVVSGLGVRLSAQRWRLPMKIIITCPVVLTCDGGVRSFVPGLTVEVDAATAEQILAQQAGIYAEPAADAPSTPRRRKSADDQT